jgi:hypothetical protein
MGSRLGKACLCWNNKGLVAKTTKRGEWAYCLDASLAIPETDRGGGEEARSAQYLL